MRGLLLAISFLTTLPVYNRVAREEEMARSLFYYPLVGFLIGLFLCLIAYIGQYLNLGWAGDVLVIAGWAVISGGLHLDGLMDSADGLFSGRERERKLEIMKDSRVGAMGVLALIMVILLKVSFMGLLSPPFKYGILLIAPALGRAMMLYPISYFPYARPEGGLGKSFGEQISKWVFPWAIGLILAVTYPAAGIQALLAVSLTALLAAWAAGRIAHILGGHTGDTYGALCEITETLLLVMAAITVKTLGL